MLGTVRTREAGATCATVSKIVSTRRRARHDRAQTVERGRYDIVDFGRELRFVGGEATPLGPEPVRSFFRRVVPTAVPPE